MTNLIDKHGFDKLDLPGSGRRVLIGGNANHVALSYPLATLSSPLTTQCSDQPYSPQGWLFNIVEKGANMLFGEAGGKEATGGREGDERDERDEKR